MAKRALSILAVVVILFGVLSNTAQAQDNTAARDQELINEYLSATENCEDPSLECLIYYTLNYTAIQLTQNIVPINGLSSGGTINENPDGSPAVAQRQGIVPGLAYLIGQMYATPPANTHVYVADVLNSAGIGIAQPAYAQGLGFVALNPILELWKTFRNIAYMFFVVIFIVIGFLIMFRKKVNQQAITAQQAIPSIIVSLLFVTFSYAIAGFMIDLMYLSMYLIIGLFGVVFRDNPDIINYNIFELSWVFMKSGAVEGFSAGSNIVEKMINSILGTNNSLIGDTFGWVAGITVGLVIAIAVLIGAFKLFFELLKSYATIVISVVTAPIQLMVGAIPGKDAFGPWIRNLIANLAVFPVVLVVAVMFYLFTQQVNVSDGGFMPPFLVGRGMPDAITSLMGLAILLALPEIVKDVKKRLGASGGFGEMVAGAAVTTARQAAPVGTKAVGAGMGATVGTVGGIGRGLWDTRGQSWDASRLINIGTSAGRNIGNATARGASLYGRIGSKIGTSPGLLKDIEGGIDSGTTALTDDARLKRIANRTGWFGRERASSATDYRTRRQLAEQKAAKADWEEERLRRGEFTTPVARE